MSDDEEVMHSDEEGSDAEEESNSESEEDEAPNRPMSRADEGPSEAQLAMQKRRNQQQSSSGLDDEAEDLLEANRVERAKMEEEINEMRTRSEQRKKEREQEEREMAERRQEEEARRKADEEERKRKKTDEDNSKKEARAKKMAEFEKWKNVSTPNFVIERKTPTGGGGGDEDTPEGEKKSREQLEAEKKAILKQRIQPLDTAGFDASKMAEKARELHNQLHRLESEKYDLERRFKAQLGDMLELAERARGMNKVGKQGSIKRIQMAEEESDLIQERFAGCPAKIVMYSQFERQMDKRPYVDRKDLYKGPVYGFAAAKIDPERRVIWDEGTGLPLYEDIPGVEKKEVEDEE